MVFLPIRLAFVITKMQFKPLLLEPPRDRGLATTLGTTHLNRIGLSCFRLG